MSDAEKWKTYYDRTENRPPRDVLVKAAKLFATTGVAIDLGCGAGRDTVALLEMGWQVLAIDGQETALSRLQANVPAHQQQRLTTQTSRFEALSALPPAQLINASYSLPFCQPTAFPALWQTIQDALQPNGRFAGNFFGLDDEWASRPDRTHLSEAEVQKLFTHFTIEYWHEENEVGDTASGKRKHWHVYTVIAKKK